MLLRMCVMQTDVCEVLDAVLDLLRSGSWCWVRVDVLESACFEL